MEQEGYMTNGEKFREIFSISQVDEGELYAYMWLPSHDAVYIPRDWWNAEYKEPTTKNDVPDNNVGKIDPTAKNDLAVDCIVDVLGSYTDLDIPYKREIAENILTKLPSVTPREPKAGHWIDCDNSEDYSADGYDCSVCGVNAEYATSYCPNCGAKMVEPQESESDA